MCGLWVGRRADRPRNRGSDHDVERDLSGGRPVADPETSVGAERRPEARLGAALRTAREAQGISLRALARQLNYSAHSNLVEYERGHRLAPLPVVQGYETALNLPSGSLTALHEEVRSELLDADGFRRPKSGPDPGSVPPPPPPRAGRRTRALLALGVLGVVIAAIILATQISGDDEPRGPTLGPVNIEEPPGRRVPQCWRFRGSADLPVDTTVVLGVENLSSQAGVIYFEAVTDWETGRTGQGRWSAPQFFGSGNSSVGQVYAVHVLVMSTSTLADILAQPGSDETAWDDPEFPKGARPVHTLQVERIEGPGVC